MLKKWFKEYVEINKREILMIICLMMFGIIIGVGAYVFSGEEVKDMAICSVREVFDMSKSETYISTNIILNGIKSDAILISILAMLSVTLFGRWIIYLIMILKGAALSVYTILLFNLFGPLWGIVTFILLVLLVNILYIPALTYLTVSFLEVNFNIFKAKFSGVNVMGIYKVLLTIILSFIVMFSSIVVEQIVSNIALSIYTKL